MLRVTLYFILLHFIALNVWSVRLTRELKAYLSKKDEGFGSRAKQSINSQVRKGDSSVRVHLCSRCVRCRVCVEIPPVPPRPPVFDQHFLTVWVRGSAAKSESVEKIFVNASREEFEGRPVFLCNALLR